MFTSDKLIVRRKFNDDEKNSELTTVLLLKIGGGAGIGGVGIHGRHLNSGSRIRYIAADRQRQVISEVFYTDDSGKQVDFRAPAEPKQKAGGQVRNEIRTMDCVDCHNRPTHIYQLPDAAVDQALAAGRISPDLPFVKKEAVKVLKTEYSDRDAAAKRIAASLKDFYRLSYPAVYRDKRVAVDAAAGVAQQIYLRNVFPAMKVGWGTYPNNLGHMDFPGCFRCHDGSHASADGRTITNDCDACHKLLAIDDADPKVLTDLGMK